MQNGTHNGTHNGVGGRLAALPPVAPEPDPFREAAQELRASVFSSLSQQVMTLAGGAGSYDTARSTRLRPNQGLIPGGSADSHLSPWMRDRLRRQCQDLDRNSCIARGLVQRQQDLVVGDGFTLLAKTSDDTGGAGSKEWNQAAEWLFNRCAGEDEDGTAPPAMIRGVDLDHPELRPLEARGQMCLSEVACEFLRAWNYEGDEGYLKTDRGCIQLVEGERLQNPGRGSDKGFSGGTGASGRGQAGSIVGGVEMDADGAPVRYHITSWNTQGGAGGFASSATTAVAAEFFSLLRNPLRKVTGSTRGEPALQAAVRRIEHLEAMDETVLVAARLQACIWAFVQLENPAAELLSAAGEENTRPEDGRTEKEEEFEGGIKKYMGLNEKVVFPPPSQPGANHEQYVLMQVLLIGAEMGLPLPVSLLDGRQVNLSTIRCISQVGLKRYERLQKALKRELYIPVYRFKVARFIRAGLLPYRDDWMAHEWMAPPPPVMDPKVELDEARGLMDARLKSKKRVAREKYGINTDTEDDQIEREQKDNARRGIAPVGTPGSSGGGGGSASPGKSGLTTEDTEDAEEGKKVGQEA